MRKIGARSTYNASGNFVALLRSGWAIMAIALCFVACGDVRSRTSGRTPGGRRDTGSTPPRADFGPISYDDAEPGDSSDDPGDASRPGEDVGPRDVGSRDGGSGDGGDGGDGGARDGGSRDGGSSDGGTRDGGSRDGGAGDGGDASFPDSGPPPGSVTLFTSCGADFGGDLIVSYNGSIAVGSMRGSSLVASLQFDLQGQSGVINLGTLHRVQTGLVVNLVLNSTWTNIAQNPEVYTGLVPDPITGTLVVRNYDPANGVMDLELQSVTLQNASDLSFCTIDGTVETTRLGR